MAFRVATLSQSNFLVSNILRTQEVVSDTSIQIASGKVSRTYAGIAEESSRLISLENAGAEVQRFVDNNTLVQLRLEFMEANISQMFEIATELRQDLITALNFAIDRADLVQGYTGVRDIDTPTTTTLTASSTGYGNLTLQVLNESEAEDGSVTINLDTLRTELENDGIITTTNGPLTEEHVVNAINGVYGTGGAQQLTNPVEGLPQNVTNASGGVSGNFAGINSDDRFQIRVNGPGGLQESYKVVFDDSDTRISYYGGTSTLSEYFGFDTGVKVTTNAETIAIIERATSLMDQVADLMSVDIDGRFLFSGSKIGTQPIDVSTYLDDESLAFPPTDLNANASSAWYQGDSVETNARVSDDLSITYGVIGSDDAIDKLVRAVRVVIDSRDSNGEISGDRLEGAMNLVTAAIEELPDVRSRIGRDIKTIEQTNVIHEDFKLLSVNAIADIENVDVVQAANLLSANETQLQASFLSLSRINQLSLINFI